MKVFRIKIFFLALVSTIVLKYSIEYDYISKLPALIDVSFKKLNSNHCNVYNENQKQFRIKIDGIEYPNILPIYDNKKYDLKCLNQQIKTIKTILIWNKFRYITKQIDFGIRTPFEKNKCPLTNCEFTNDQSKLNISSLVLFHIRNDIFYFPEQRYPNQRWVHMIYEAPIHCHLCDKFQNIFNLSVTYTKESDYSSIYWTDSGLYWERNELFKDINFAANKKHFAATLISSCSGHNTRLLFIKELQKHFPIKIYGKCGHPCPIKEDCREYISNNYKFFLVFENSYCRDYITEKLFQTMRYNIIPIVLGGGNYSYYIPKSGFINAIDFESGQEIANYLLYLDGNQTAYNEYFKWKKYVKFNSDYPRTAFLCEMCIQLHLEDYLGKIEHKKLLSISERFEMHRNCNYTLFDLEKHYFKVSNEKKLKYSKFMSPNII